MASFHNTVSNYTHIDERWVLTYNAAAGITAADIGKAVEIDSSGANKVKLVTDDGEVFGRIAQFEAATNGRPAVVSVERKGVFKLTKTASAVSVGGSVVGAGSGLVKAAPAVTPSGALTAAQIASLAARGRNVIVEDLGSNVIVVELI